MALPWGSSIRGRNQMSMESKRHTFHDLQMSMALSPRDYGEGSTRPQMDLGHSDHSMPIYETTCQQAFIECLHYDRDYAHAIHVSPT